MDAALGRRGFLKLGAAGVAAGLAGVEEAFGRRLRATFGDFPRSSTAAGSPAGSREISSEQRFSRLHSAYGLAEGLTYFNHASIGTMPLIVQEAREGYQRACESNPWLYVWSDGFGDARESVREKAAGYLGCSAEEVAITHNTTEGFNVLSQGLPLGPGDEVVFSDMNHPGASVCWEQQARRRGFSVRRFEIPLGSSTHLTPEDLLGFYEGAVSPATRVLVFPHVDNILGLRHPVRQIAQTARDKGVDFIAIDGAQAVGMLDFDITDLGVDFYSTSPHKWLQAPKGTGLFYIRRDLQPLVESLWVRTASRRWRETVRKYEDYGTRNLSALMALGSAIDFQERLGRRAKEARCRELWSYFHGRVTASDALVWRSPSSWDFASSLFAVEIDGVRSQDAFARMFEEHGFVFRAFPGALNTLRISPNVMNTEEQIDRFVRIAESLQ